MEEENEVLPFGITDEEVAELLVDDMVGDTDVPDSI